MMLLRNDENEDGIFLSLVIKVKDDVFRSVTQAYSFTFSVVQYNFYK